MEKNKRALITGIHGQDGSYMAELLHEKGFEIIGLVRPGASTHHPFARIYSGDISGADTARFFIRKIKPTHIFNFAGVSDTFSPYENLDHLIDINCKMPQSFLQAIVKIDPSIRFFQASSCLVFGHDTSGSQNELTARSPMHPYGIGKLYVDQMIEEFRNKYGIFACSGIFFNHESERRGERFFTRKVSRFVAKMALGNPKETLTLGKLSAFRDFGYAPDFMQAVFMMMEDNKPEDYVIGTGKLTSLIEFVQKCFNYAGLQFGDYTEFSLDMTRKTDYTSLKCDYSKIRTNLGWEPKTTVDQIVEKMVDNDIKLLEQQYHGQA